MSSYVSGINLNMVLTMLCVGLLWAIPSVATPLEAVPLAEMRQVKKFVSVEVQTQGTAEKLGLKSSDLTDLTRLTVLNKIPGIALEGSVGPSTNSSDPPHQLGFLTCEVWTVGEQQIVAYHIDCNAGSYTAMRVPGTLWNRAILGLGPKEEVTDAVQKGLRTMIELFATTLSNARAQGGR